MKRSIYYFFVVLVCISATRAFADYSVIAHPTIEDGVTKSDIAKIFLAKSKKLPGGTKSNPVNLSESSPAREPFEKNVLGKSSSQVKAYWSRLIFTGKAVPIEELESDASVVERVSQTPGAVGYVNSTAVTDSVKVLFTY